MAHITEDESRCALGFIALAEHAVARAAFAEAVKLQNYHPGG
jgi:hypothetical protein